MHSFIPRDKAVDGPWVCRNRWLFGVRPIDAMGTFALVLAAAAPAAGAQDESAFPVISAVRAGDVDSVERLIREGGDVNEVDSLGWHPLHHALQRRDLGTEGAARLEESRAAIVSLLLEGGAEVDAAGPFGGATPLEVAAAYGIPVEILAMLFQAGARADAATSTGFTPLYRAAQRGPVENVSLLLAHGAPLDGPPDSDRPPLGGAISSGQRDVAILLLKAGADPSLSDHGTPLIHHAARMPDPTILELMEERAPGLVPPLLYEETQLRRAAMDGDRERMRRWLNRGATVDSADPEGRTALWWAAQSGFVKGVRLLLARGADPHRPDERGERPLVAALRSVSHLLEESDEPIEEQLARADSVVGEIVDLLLRSTQYRFPPDWDGELLDNPRGVPVEWDPSPNLPIIGLMEISWADTLSPGTVSVKAFQAPDTASRIVRELHVAVWPDLVRLEGTCPCGVPVLAQRGSWYHVGLVGLPSTGFIPEEGWLHLPLETFEVKAFPNQASRMRSVRALLGEHSPTYVARVRGSQADRGEVWAKVEVWRKHDSAGSFVPSVMAVGWVRVHPSRARSTLIPIQDR